MVTKKTLEDSWREVSRCLDEVLELEPSKEIPRIDQHLGELLRPGQHALEFNLVKEVNPQG